MKRRIQVGIGVTLLFVCVGAFAQEPPKPRRIGFLGSRARPESLETDYYGRIPTVLRELGYVEGKDFVMEWRFAGGDYSKLPALAAELVAIPVDVLVTDGSPGIRAAQASTKTIPIVFGGGADLVKDGFIQSLAHPGGNTTGCSLLLSDTAGKQLELLAAWAPRLTRVAVLFNPGNPAHAALLKQVVDAAEARQMHVLSVGAQSPKEIDAAFGLAAADKSQALIWLTDSFLFQQGRQSATLAAKNHIPSLSGYPEYAGQGGLMGYGPNRPDLYRCMTGYVDRVLKGANPGDLPVQQPTKLDLIINKTTARTLGLTIPPEVLIQADKVIE